MNYEIQKVANGYIVKPGYSITRDGTYCNGDVYVFATVAAAAEWLAEKFGEAAC